jgi:hypothetical protein
MTNAPNRGHDASSAPERWKTAVRSATRRVRTDRRREVDAVTAVRPQVLAPELSDVPGPVPRRVRPPRWLDLRLVLGVLLVLGSVLLGARVMGASDATVPVWAAGGNLAAGTVLSSDDLVVVDVRLDDAAGAYLSATTRPAGRSLSRAVGKGELLPRTALDAPADMVQLGLPVQAGYVPPGLERGRLVDVYALDTAGSGGSAAAASAAAGTAAAAGSAVIPVVTGAPVEAVSGRSQGVLSTPTTTVQVVVSLPAGRAPQVLAAIAGRPLVVVLRNSVDQTAESTAGPTTAPTAGPTG